MKENLIDSSKTKGKRNKSNNNKIGKKGKKPELIYYIKSLTIGKGKLKNTNILKNSN